MKQATFISVVYPFINHRHPFMPHEAAHFNIHVERSLSVTQPSLFRYFIEHSTFISAAWRPLNDSSRQTFMHHGADHFIIHFGLFILVVSAFTILLL